MALRFVDSFDHYGTSDILKKWTSYGSSSAFAIVSPGRRSGTTCLRNTSPSSYAISKTIDNQAAWVIGFAFQCSDLPGSSTRLVALFDAGSTQCDLRLNPDGTLSVTRNGTAVTNGTSVSTLSVNVWHYIEWKVTIADSISAGSCKVRLNGVDIITVATSQDLKNTSNASANQIQLNGNVGSFGGSAYYDDLYICDGTGSTNNDFLGDCRVDVIFPNGAGNYTQLTPSTGSNYTCVDESTPNTTDYVSGSTVNDRDSYTLGDLPALTSQTVHGVQVNAAILKDDAGIRSVGTMVRSSSTNSDGSGVALSVSQTYITQIYEMNPNGSVAWTETTVNAMEAGVKITS